MVTTGNRRIGQLLADLSLPAGEDKIPEALKLCYEVLVENGFVGAAELPLLDAFLSDFAELS